MSCEIMNKVFKEINDKSTRIEFLSQKLDLSTKSISQAVGNLIKHGYVTRSATGIYRLTEKGKSLKNSGKPLIINPGPEKGYEWPVKEKKRLSQPSLEGNPYQTKVYRQRYFNVGKKRLRETSP